MANNRLDNRGRFPSGMEEYMSMYNWVFSKKLAEFAVGKMKKVDPKTGKEIPTTPWTKEQVDELLKKYNIKLENDNGYDSYWCANMCKFDYLGESVPDEAHAAMFVRNFVDDPDGYRGKCLTHYYADCLGKGVIIPWLDVI